jgi:hypothetical protein
MAYSQAMNAAGWRQAVNPMEDGVKVALFDHDVGPAGMGFRIPLDELNRRKVPVLMYPHAARPNLQWDGMYPLWKHTRVMFVMSEGQAEIMRLYGYPLPIEPIGWSLCPILDWKPVEIKRKIKVLFGPIHPNGNGYLHEIDKNTNIRIYSMLMNTPGIDLTVRHIKRIDLSGIRKMVGPKYKLGRAQISDVWEDIRAADVVIGHQTMAYMAVAMGKPVIMFGDQNIPHSGNHAATMKWAKSYDKYQQLLRYPMEAENAGDGPALRLMLERVMKRNVGKSWKERMIGDAFNAGRFVELVEKYASS